jgi:NAD(P)H-dependent flavin oxidoreductase YrpB (nitropropane dioxygenase family)
MMAVSDFDSLMSVALEEKVDAIFIGAGMLLKRPKISDNEFVDSLVTKIIPKVSSARAANIIFRKWDKAYGTVPDALVVEGPLAGGHLGYDKSNIDGDDIALEKTISETNFILDIYREKYSREIPLIAGGGVYTSEDMFNIIEAGADAVKMGSRFVTTDECDASDEFKENYINCNKEDITLIDSPVGLPGRVIRNKFVDDINAGKSKPVNCPWKCLKNCNFKEVKFCVALALANAAAGNFEAGFSFAGSRAYLAEEIKSVKKTFADIIDEFNIARTKFLGTSFS